MIGYSLILGIFFSRKEQAVLCAESLKIPSLFCICSSSETTLLCCILVNIPTVPEPWPSSKTEQMRTHTSPPGSSQSISWEQTLLLPQNASPSLCVLAAFTSKIIYICSLFLCMSKRAVVLQTILIFPRRHCPAPSSLWPWDSFKTSKTTGQCLRRASVCRWGKNTQTSCGTFYEHDNLEANPA